MRNFKFLVLMVVAFGVSGVAKAWEGVSVSDASGKGDLYLYNVGTGKFMCNDGIWGTQAVLSDVGLSFTLGSSTSSGKYNIKTSVQNPQASGNVYLEYSNGANIADPGYLFVDQGSSRTTSEFTFLEVPGSSNVYTISVTSSEGDKEYQGTFYLGAVGNDIKGISTNTSDNEKWMIVTLKEIKDNFNKTEGTNAKPAPAWFLLKDPGFKRGDQDISNWKYVDGEESGDVANNSSYSGGKWTSISNEGAYNTKKPTDAVASGESYTYSVTCQYNKSGSSYGDFHTVTVTSAEKYDQTYITSNFIECGKSHVTFPIKTLARQKIVFVSENKNNPVYTYYVGNGNGEGHENGAKDGTYLQQKDGGKWTANIHGKEGKIYQDITIERTGWYLVSCNGFSTDGTGYIFASANNATNGDGYKAQVFETVEAPETYIAASDLLSTKEYQSILVYVKAGETLRIGAYVENGSYNSWTCFDNFSLAYCGDIVEENLKLILDEEQTAIDYINAQVNADKAQNLYLNRSFKADKWNSLVLPVDLTAQQVKTAFGGGTKLSALNRTEADGMKIFFEPVSLGTDGVTAIEKGKLYIIKPQVEEPDGDKVTRKITIDGNEKEITVEKYYFINQVTLAAEIESPEVSGNVFESSEDNGIQHVGTYVWKKSTAIPAETYILSNGKWYYNTVAVNSCKGFRGWLETNKSGNSDARIYINGILDCEGSGTTAIDNVNVESHAINVGEGVFNLNGQQIRGVSSLDGLARGIYIVGGKKVVVK